MSATTVQIRRGLTLRLLAEAYGWRQYRRMLSLDFAPAIELRALQARKLRRLLQHARARVPYYGEMLERHALKLDNRDPTAILQELPLLTKRDIEASFPDHILSHGRRRFGSKHLTSTGTTRDRIDVVLSLSAQHCRHAQQLWSDDLGGGCGLGLRRLEIPPDACSRECGFNEERPAHLLDDIRRAAGRSGKPAKEFLAALGQRLREAVRTRLLNDRTLPPFGPQGTSIPNNALQWYVDAIRQERPFLLTGLPTYLHEIARYLRRTGQEVRVAVVRPIGSVSTPALKQFIAESFRGEVFETYGSNELGGIACECAAHGWLHVAMGSFLVEILRDGKPAGPGELGRIVVTCLDNYEMPLIRYDLGDVGRWHRGPCDCGRTTQLIECNGRIQDLIVTSKGKPITEEEVMDLAYFELGLEHFQLVERKRGEFDLMVVPAPGQRLDLQAIRTAISQLLDQPRRIDVYPAKTIYPEATGKFRFVKSASYGGFG